MIKQDDTTFCPDRLHYCGKLCQFEKVEDLDMSRMFGATTTTVAESSSTVALVPGFVFGGSGLLWVFH